ncbi:MAG: tetratricopeptide repeat protein, partial [Pseudonocardiaceae bacterium]
PLALAIVAARAATHPGFALGVLAKELADEHTRLDALDTGDPTASVRAVFSWSYRHLSSATARMFRFLGLHPGPDIALAAAAHLTEIPPHQAREALGELTRVHLLTQHTPGRYAFHDLLRAYATHLTTTQDRPEDQHTALTHLFDYYLHTSAAAMTILQPADHHHRRPLPSSAIPTPAVADPTTAQRWLNTERANLAAIITHTAAHGWHTYTTQLATTVLHSYFGVVHHPQALALYTHVQHTAHHTNDHATEVLALNGLGLIHWQQGRYQQATEHHQQALAICRKTGDRIGEALALNGLGFVHWQQGRYQQATEHYEKALMIGRETGSRSGEATALNGLGFVHGRQGRYQQATEHHQQALTICRDIGCRDVEAQILNSLGAAYHATRQLAQAHTQHTAALTLATELGNRYGQAHAHHGLARTHHTTGNLDQAHHHWQQALTLYTNLGIPTPTTTPPP